MPRVEQVQYVARPLTPGTPNPLQLWGGVYAEQPNGLTAVALCFQQSDAKRICELLNGADTVPTWIADLAPLRH